MRFRIAAAVAVGIVLIGILAWPMVAPTDPLAPITFANHNITLHNMAALALLAFATGLIAYFLSYPYGRQIAPIAVPTGLAIWVARTGNLSNLIQTNSTLNQRQAIFATLEWEPFLWLAIIAAGFIGILAAQKIRAKQIQCEPEQKTNSKTNKYLNFAIAFVGSILLTKILVGVFAQDVTTYDIRLGHVTSQPDTAQIIFALLAAFGITAFLAKILLNANYIWPALAAAVLPAIVNTVYIKEDVLERLVGHWPDVFFPNAAVSIVPIQMVTFGVLGSIIGYWMAVRFNYWRTYTAHGEESQ